MVLYAPFPQSYSVGDVTKELVLLLSMGLFPLIESDSDVTIAKFGMSSVPIFSNTNLSLSANSPSDSDVAFALWKRNSNLIKNTLYSVRLRNSNKVRAKSRL